MSILEQSPVLTPEEAAAYLRLSELGVRRPDQTLEYLVKTRQLAATTIAGRRAFLRQQLDAYVNRELDRATSTGTHKIGGNDEKSTPKTGHRAYATQA